MRDRVAHLATRARVAAWRPVRELLASRDLYLVRGRSQRLDHTLASVFEAMGTDCVVDVGANVGQYVGVLRESGWGGPVVSFEPVPSTFRALEERWGWDRRWTGHAVSCGVEDGVATIDHYDGASDLDSFRAPTEYGRERLLGLRGTPMPVEVPVRRLDRLWDEVLPPPATSVHLKIDTQGSDLAVLEGASGVLDRIRSLQIEMPAKPVYEGLPSLAAHFDAVMALGFEVVACYPVARDRDALRAVELDGVFVRPPVGP